MAFGAAMDEADILAQNNLQPRFVLHQKPVLHLRYANTFEMISD